MRQARQRIVRRSLASSYIRPPPSSFTEACEAPTPMWDGAIPLHTVRRGVGKGFASAVEKTYHHPPEVQPRDLEFGHINAMYCMSNEALRATYPEGLGGKVMQMMPPGHPRGFLYRRESHLLNTCIEKLAMWERKQDVIQSLTGGRSGLILDGATGTGKSALMCQAVHFARQRGLITLYIPNAKDWTHGEWCWPSAILPGFFDAPDAGRLMLRHFARAHRGELSKWTLRVTPKDLPINSGERQPATVYDLCEWANAVAAPASIDRQSVAVKFFMDEIMAEPQRPVLFVVDGYNLFAHDTHFRYPHPDFLRTLPTLNDGSTDIDLYPQELPRIPASRLSFVRGLNKIILDAAAHRNKFFVTCTTRDFKPFDGISGFADVVKDKHKNSLDEYAPYDAEKDSLFHPMQVGNFNEYEYRSFLRFAVNSGELAGLGWGPLWHYASDFERKLYKIDFLSDRNPQRVVDHYHQEIVWKTEYQRIRQKQFLLKRHTEQTMAVK